MVYRPHVDDQSCFVIMPFNEQFNLYYKDIIKHAVIEAGLIPKRSDEIYGTRPIIEDIWDSIWKARLVVADVTTKNPNVNYELGLCHALGIPTIIISGDINDVPFDYRQLRCIIYDVNEVNWQSKLSSQLVKTIHVSTKEGEMSEH